MICIYSRVTTLWALSIECGPTEWVDGGGPWRQYNEKVNIYHSLGYRQWQWRRSWIQNNNDIRHVSFNRLAIGSSATAGPIQMFGAIQKYEEKYEYDDVLIKMLINYHY